MAPRLLALLSFLTISFQAFAQGIGVVPSTLSFTLNRNRSQTQVVTLSNDSKSRIQFRLYLADWLRDSVGGHEYLAPGTLSRSCSRWISVDPAFVELEPGKTAKVQVRMQLPDSAAAAEEMKWSMLFVETVDEQKSFGVSKMETMVKNLLRVGVHIYQTPPGINQKATSITGFAADPAQPRTYLLSCRNTGKTMLGCKSYLELTSLQDQKKTRIDARELPMFPDQMRVISFRIPDSLPKGKYSMLGVIDAGDDVPLEVAEKTIDIN
jgi:P pilus assembly chaperone PapD